MEHPSNPAAASSTLLYQPRFDCRSGRLSGVHASVAGLDKADGSFLDNLSGAGLMALREALPGLRRVQGYDLFPAQTERFGADLEPQLGGASFVPCSDPEAAVRDADVVVTCVPIVTNPQRFVPLSWLKPDALAISVDYDAAFCEDVMGGSFFCDDREQYLWTQDHGVYFRGYPREEGITGDMGDLCAGKVEPVRQGRRGAVLMGIALDDVMVGSLFHRRAMERGVGKTLEL